MTTADDIRSELLAIEDDLDQVLMQSGTLARYEVADDGMSGRTETWTPDGTIDVHFEQGRGTEPTRTGERKETGADPISLKYRIGESLSIRDRITVHDLTWEVMEVEEQGTWSFLNRCYVVVVDT